MADVLPAVLLHQVHRKFIREYWARRMYHIHRDTKNILPQNFKKQSEAKQKIN